MPEDKPGTPQIDAEPLPPLEKQKQDPPGLESEMRPRPRYRAERYRPDGHPLTDLGRIRPARHRRRAGRIRCRSVRRSALGLGAGCDSVSAFQRVRERRRWLVSHQG